MAKARAGQLRHILSSEDLELDTKLSLYVSVDMPVLSTVLLESVVSVLL